MRELEFRAWSNEHNRYCDFVSLDENGRWIGWIMSSGIYLTTIDIIVEQYTGLNDKNGVGICESDILEDGSGDPIEYWTVKFEDGKFIGSTQGVDEDIFELTDLEVIGNIHENADLLGR